MDHLRIDAYYNRTPVLKESGIRPYSDIVVFPFVTADDTKKKLYIKSDINIINKMPCWNAKCLWILQTVFLYFNHLTKTALP